METTLYFTVEEMHEFIMRTGKYNCMKRHNLVMYTPKFSNTDWDEYIEMNGLHTFEMEYGLRPTFRKELCKKLLML